MTALAWPGDEIIPCAPDEFADEPCVAEVETSGNSGVVGAGIICGVRLPVSKPRAGCPEKLSESPPAESDHVGVGYGVTPAVHPVLARPRADPIDGVVTERVAGRHRLGRPAAHEMVSPSTELDRDMLQLPWVRST